MISELSNFLFFLYAIAKVLAMTGLGLAGVIVVIAECCGLRIVALGLEKVRGGQLADQPGFSVLPATSLPRRKVRAA